MYGVVRRVHELREYVFKASPLGMTARNSEIQEQQHAIGRTPSLSSALCRATPRHANSVCSWFLLPLVRTHLIYGSVYASHGSGAGAYIDYRRCKRGTIECNQRRERRGAALSALILNRGSCGCLECLSRIFLRLFVI